MDRAELIFGVIKQAELIERAELECRESDVTNLLVSLRDLLNDQPELKAGRAHRVPDTIEPSLRDTP
ncbi:hypothetical protein ES702_05099 [subsurface metagenome]